MTSLEEENRVCFFLCPSQCSDIKYLSTNLQDRKLSHQLDCTLKTGIPVDNGDSIFELLRGVSLPEIKFGVWISQTEL